MSTDKGTDPGNVPVAGPGETALPAEATLFSVAKGDPTAEELAALAAVVASLAAPQAEPPAKPTVRHWVRRQQLRLGPVPGPGAWRRSRG